MSKAFSVLILASVILSANVAHADDQLEKARKEISDLKTEVKSMSREQLVALDSAYRAEVAGACSLSATIVVASGALETVPLLSIIPGAIFTANPPHDWDPGLIFAGSGILGVGELASDVMKLLSGEEVPASPLYPATRLAAEKLLRSEKSLCARSVLKLRVVAQEYRSRPSPASIALEWVSNKVKKTFQDVEALKEKAENKAGQLVREATAKN